MLENGVTHIFTSLYIFKHMSHKSVFSGFDLNDFLFPV